MKRGIRKRKRPPSHPGRILRELYLEAFSVTVTALAERLNVSRKTLSKILNERGSISVDMALRLSRAFKTSPQVWLNLQRNYDLWLVASRSREWERVLPIEKSSYRDSKETLQESLR